jgi:hypothetical protein
MVCPECQQVIVGRTGTIVLILETKNGLSIGRKSFAKTSLTLVESGVKFHQIFPNRPFNLAL